MPRMTNSESDIEDGYIEENPGTEPPMLFHNFIFLFFVFVSQRACYCKPMCHIVMHLFLQCQGYDASKLIYRNPVLRIRDPGSGAFLTPGSGIRNRFFPDPGSRIPDP